MTRHSVTFLLGATVSLLALAAPAQAQVNPQPQDPRPAPADPASHATGDEAQTTVVVTGSRLRRDPNSVAPLPIVTVTAEDFRTTGQNDVAETLREVPALIASGTVADSIERGGGGVGQATLNLRGLGSNRTLVLVNGRRHVSGVAGAQTVDVATIPTALVESVDVQTGGSSAIYGADAVTGVVNFNLNQKFDGFVVDGQVGIASQGDGRTYSLDATLGRNFASGRGNVVVSLGYDNNQELQQGDRGFSRANSQANNSTTYGNPARRFQRGDISAATLARQHRTSHRGSA